MKQGVYDSLTKNLFKHLSKGEEVSFQNMTLRKDGDRIVVKGRINEGEEVELVYKLERGSLYGMSKEQLKRIVTFKEKPLFRTHIKK